MEIQGERAQIRVYGDAVSSVLHKSEALWVLL